MLQDTTISCLHEVCATHPGPYKPTAIRFVDFDDFQDVPNVRVFFLRSHNIHHFYFIAACLWWYIYLMELPIVISQGHQPNWVPIWQCLHSTDWGMPAVMNYPPGTTIHVVLEVGRYPGKTVSTRIQLALPLFQSWSPQALQPTSIPCHLAWQTLTLKLRDWFVVVWSLSGVTVYGSLNLTWTGVTEQTNWRWPRTTLPDRTMSWLVLLVTLIDNMVASPSFEGVRDSWTVQCPPLLLRMDLLSLPHSHTNICPPTIWDINSNCCLQTNRTLEPSNCSTCCIWTDDIWLFRKPSDTIQTWVPVSHKSSKGLSSRYHCTEHFLPTSLATHSCCLGVIWLAYTFSSWVSPNPFPLRAPLSENITPMSLLLLKGG